VGRGVCGGRIHVSLFAHPLPASTPRIRTPSPLLPWHARRFLEQDLPLFKGIVSDLFPGVDVPFVDYGRLQSAIEEQLDLAGLQRVPSLITKIIQTHETQLVRHGMMLVGEAGSGKTVNQDVLAKALSQLKREGVVDKDGFYQHVQRFILNPKAVTMGDLYGEFNLMTQVRREAMRCRMGGGGRDATLHTVPVCARAGVARRAGRHAGAGGGDGPLR